MGRRRGQVSRQESKQEQVEVEGSLLGAQVEEGFESRASPRS